MKTLRDLSPHGCAAPILAALVLALLLAGCTGPKYQPNHNHDPITPVNGAGLAVTR